MQRRTGEMVSKILRGARGYVGTSWGTGELGMGREKTRNLYDTHLFKSRPIIQLYLTYTAVLENPCAENAE